MIAIVAHRWGSTVQNLLESDLPIGPIFLSTPPNINYNNYLVTDDQESIFGKCREAGVKYVALAGYRKKLIIPEDFTNRVINIHPSLLPSFGGKGMYGINVHRAVVNSGVKISGCTVHFVNNEYDSGPIIAQYPVAVWPEYTPEILEESVKSKEKKLYPFVIKKLMQESFVVKGRLVDLNTDNWSHCL